MNEPGVRYCGECGSAIGGASPTAGSKAAITTPHPIGSATERRLVSVLFADLVGFTALSESRDAEEVRDLLSRYFDTCRTLIDRYGGTVEKFIGDAVMAVWGTPSAKEDDAERAVRAALDLTAAVVALGQEVGVPELRARAGVLTGEAAVDLGAEGQGMVAGDLVNTASRIQSVAQPGSVLVGETTRRASDGAIAYEDAGSHGLKGKAEPVRLWRAMRVIGLRGGVLRSSVIEPPFVGRDRELRLIKELFHATAEEHRPHLVSVVGVGGIGKSRMMWEFQKYIDGLAEEVWWHQGRCLAYGEGVAFWALAEMVRGRAGVVEDEDVASARAKLASAVAEHVTEAVERRFAEPRLAHLLGLEDRGEGDQENLFSAWRIFFERLAESGPTVMVFEDVHWADSSLLDFIEYLLDWSREHPIFIVTLARPELIERHPTWGAGKRNFTSLSLGPLQPDAMDLLLRAPVPELPIEVRTQILDRAEGVPFYAVETVRMLIDRGLLIREGDGHRLAGPIETLEVPETLQALIAARLDGLEPEERHLLQTASVLGRTFAVSGLSALTGRPETDLQPILASLVRKEVLTLSVDPMSPERGQFGFLQDLVKKVAYDTMSKKERRTHHLAAAAFLEASSGEQDEIIEVVAAHLLDAYRAGPEAPDAPEIRAKATTSLVRAAERASSLGASLAAQRSFERAAELADGSLDQAELLERAGTMAWAALRQGDATRHFEEALALFESAGATHSAARVSARLAQQMWDRGRLREGLATMEHAFQVLSPEERDEDLAWLAAQLGRFLFFAGDVDAAVTPIEVALDIAEELGLWETLSQALNTKSLLLGARGRDEEAGALLRHALAVALANDKPSAALRAYNNLVDDATHRDSYEEALARVNDGLTLTRRVGNRYWEMAFLGYCYPLYCMGRWDEALAQMGQLAGEDLTDMRVAFAQGYVAFGTAIHVHRGELDEAKQRVALFKEMSASADVQERAEYGCGEATLLLALGESEGALAAASKVVDQADALSYGHHAVKESFVIAIEAAIDHGDLERAQELLSTIEALPAVRRPAFLRAHSLRLGAKLASRQAESEAFERGSRAAVGAFREIGLPFWLAVTLFEHGKWLISEGRSEEAGPFLVEAQDIFGRLRAIPWLERAEAVLPAEARRAAVDSLP